MVHIFGELVPDEEDTRFSQTVGIDDFGDPALEGLQIVHQSPAAAADHGRGALQGFQIAAVYLRTKLVHGGIIVAKGRAFQNVLPVNRIIIQLGFNSVQQGAAAQIGLVAKLGDERLAHSLFRFQQHHIAGTDTGAAGFPDDEVISVPPAFHEAGSIGGQQLMAGHKGIHDLGLFLQQVLDKDSRVALASAIGAMHPE